MNALSVEHLIGFVLKGFLNDMFKEALIHRFKQLAYNRHEVLIVFDLFEKIKNDH